VWTGYSCITTIASLRFQPTKRPQIAAQKAKAKAIASKFAQPPVSNPAIPPQAAAANEAPAPDQPSAPQSAPTKTTIADWTTTASDDENINDFYLGEKRPRGGRKKRKKGREHEEIVQNWDDIYDPSRPNNYEDYKNSEEKIREVREWKDRLYAHRTQRRASTAHSSGDSRNGRPTMNRMVDAENEPKVTLTSIFRRFRSSSSSSCSSSSSSTCNVLRSPAKSQPRDDVAAVLSSRPRRR
jgi:splicing factor 45